MPSLRIPAEFLRAAVRELLDYQVFPTELLFTQGDVVTIMIQTLEHVSKVQKQMMRMLF
jgi:hypothetical protein